MSFYQLFKFIDDAGLVMSKKKYSIILETFLVSEEALDCVLGFKDEDLFTKEKMRKKRTHSSWSSHVFILARITFIFSLFD